MWYYICTNASYIVTDFPDLFGRVESEFTESVGSKFARVSQAAATIANAVFETNESAF